MQNLVAITTLNISKYVYVYAFEVKHLHYRSQKLCKYDCMCNVSASFRLARSFRTRYNVHYRYESALWYRIIETADSDENSGRRSAVK